MRTLSIYGSSSETIGTNSYLGQLYVTNSLGGTAASPSVSGSTFNVSAFSSVSGTQNVVAAIGDAAGNVGYATNTIVVSLFTNAVYLYNTNGAVTNIAYAGSNVSENVSFTWDSKGQMTGVATNGAVAESYVYDPIGRRVKIIAGGTTNVLVYDGNELIAESDGNGSLIRSYMYGPGVENILAMNVHSGGVVTTYWFLKDMQGTVHAVADEAGNIVESYKYDAWGRVLGVYDANNVAIGQSAIGNRFLYQGKQYCWSVHATTGAGIYLFGSRWYDPVTGRWLSKDPGGVTSSLNEYEFCFSDPVNFVDPDGESPRESRDWWQACAVGGCSKGGFGGYSQAVGASIMVSFIDFFSTCEVETLAEVSGTYKGEGCDLKALQTAMLVAGMVAMQAVPGGGKAGSKVLLKGVEKELAEAAAKKGIGAEAGIVAKNLDKFSRTPKSLMDQMVLDAAKQGKGVKLPIELGDPKFKGMEKWSYTEKSASGLRSDVHYVRDAKTGELMDFKFNIHAVR